MTNETNKQINIAELMGAYRGANNEHTVYTSTLERLKASEIIDMSDVKSCVAVGAGMAEREIEFIVRFMPNLRTFIAVDPDIELTAGLRTNFQQQLPGVQLIVRNETIQNWQGVEQQPVDVVLVFKLLYHISVADRRTLFRKLSTDVLIDDGGYVVILNEVDSSGIGALWAIWNDNYKAAIDGVEVRKDMSDAGLQPLVERDIDYFVDMKDVANENGDALVESYLPHASKSISKKEVRRLLIANKPRSMMCSRMSVYRRIASEIRNERDNDCC